MEQFGTRVYSLSQIVDRFNLKQGNDKQRYYPRTLMFAEEGWKDIFQNTLWEIKQVALQVCDGEIHLPQDCKRLLTISVVDHCKRTNVLTFNPHLSTVEMNCLKRKCSCSNCHGNDTLCDLNDNLTVVTENVDIKGTNYVKTIYTRIDSEGNIWTDANTPAYDAATDSVVYTDVQSVVGTLEVTNKGCIVNCPRNIETIKNCCFTYLDLGNWWNGYGRRNENILPPDPTYFGFWNWNAETQDIIHIYGNIDRVVIAYQTNGENVGGGVIVPDYAENAVDNYILWQQKVFNPKDGDRSMAGFYQYQGAKTRLQRYLNRVRMDSLMKLQERLRRW